ncbi:hypothetical protein EFY79_02315 [Hanamia caeni]|uniref:Uncharacterized protein n=1 Tax=Hanamia caeni TaxID=2294116 RepID=A0A3M9NQR0_9BACT|nr:hypothetical protein EFY79_02315 [Hanamia caeni]
MKDQKILNLIIVFNISDLKNVNQLTKLRKFIYAIKNIIASKRTNKRDSYFYFDARFIGKQKESSKCKHRLFTFSLVKAGHNIKFQILY